MRSLYQWILRTLILILILFVLVQAIILMIGTRLALNLYATRNFENLSSFALDILLDPDNPSIEGLDYAQSFFIFRFDKELVYSTRGRGRSISESDLIPVYHDGAIIGYWYSGEIRFQDDEENKLFLLSLAIMMGISLFMSLVVGMFAAFFTARKLSGFIQILRSDIHLVDGRHQTELRRFPISEFTEISDSIRIVSHQLAREDEYKQQWMQDLAHDLRTPLSGLRGQFEAMRDGVLQANPERFEKNLQELSHLENMVANINELYTLENVREIKWEDFHCDRLLTDLLRIFESRVTKENLITFLDSSISVKGDYQLLVRALTNLLDNGLKYRSSESPVEFSVKDQNSMVKFTVSNQIPNEFTENPDVLFGRFYRGDFSRSTPGTGLGLNIAREIAIRHGGSLNVELLDSQIIQFIMAIPRKLTQES